MSKPKLQLFIRTTHLAFIETPVYVFDQRSWAGARAAIRSRCLGGHSWSAYFLAGTLRPSEWLGEVDPHVIQHVIVDTFNGPLLRLNIREHFDGTYIGESQYMFRRDGSWDRLVQLISTSIES